MKRTNAPRSTADASSARNAQIAAIHVLASKELNLDRDTYLAILQRVAGVGSAADLDGRGRRQVLDELRRLSGKPGPSKAREPLPDAPVEPRPELASMLTKIDAMLRSAGRTWAYAHGTAQRMFGVARAEWLSSDQLHRVVAALTYDQQRRAKR